MIDDTSRDGPRFAQDLLASSAIPLPPSSRGVGWSQGVLQPAPAGRLATGLRELLADHLPGDHPWVSAALVDLGPTRLRALETLEVHLPERLSFLLILPVALRSSTGSLETSELVLRSDQFQQDGSRNWISGACGPFDAVSGSALLVVSGAEGDAGSVPGSAAATFALQDTHGPHLLSLESGSTPLTVSALRSLAEELPPGDDLRQLIEEVLIPFTEFLDELQRDLLGPTTHALLDLLGLIPLVGNIADVVNVILSLCEAIKYGIRGEDIAPYLEDAAWSLAGVIPALGQVATLSKWVRKLLRLGGRLEEASGKLRQVVDRLRELAKKLRRPEAPPAGPKPKPPAKPPAQPEPPAPTSGMGPRPATSENARDALQRKLKQLARAQEEAVEVRRLPDGRVRYYEAEIPASSPGPTRGACKVTEHDPKTGRVRTWYESRGHDGEVVRVHPKSIDGQVAQGQHYPPTGAERAAWGE